MTWNDEKHPYEDHKGTPPGKWIFVMFVLASFVAPLLYLVYDDAYPVACTGGGSLIAALLTCYFYVSWQKDAERARAVIISILFIVVLLAEWVVVIYFS